MEEDRYTQITLRIPKDLHASLREQAQATSKSLNAEIIARLQQSFQGSQQGLPRHHGVEDFAADNGISYEEALDLIVMRGISPNAPAAYLVNLHSGMTMGEVRAAIQEIGKHAPADASIITNYGRPRSTRIGGGQSVGMTRLDATKKTKA